ncbi:hypothetical protein QBC35DRAFT_223115 [Podospora australis]|uniref:SMODS and SLOG-associating 2TM effector domain-containing protein n=1 Tax=Podospora australis TaxID=1536484 RepID=A0AAN6X1P1_9PEZI|nr:hypothetical protein QBC35DRAFT_223115 [Podospora australis]
MALPRDASRLSLPGLESSGTTGSFYNLKPEKPSSIPVPTARPGSTNNPTTSKPPQGAQPKPGSPRIHHRFLSPAEWARVAHGLGAIREGETHQVVHPTCWYWPPKGLPEGLYRDVVTQRTKYFISYHMLSAIRWLLMLLQIVLGAILTALGSYQLTDGTPITVLAAINTVDAGLLALLHNSGLPDRYRLDKVEFIKVEDFLKEILNTGIVDASFTVDDILSDCFGRFQQAKSTVLANMPDAYTTAPLSSPKVGEKSLMICPDPAIHFAPVQPQSSSS